MAVEAMRRRPRLRVLSLALWPAVLVALAGCGHTVTPTAAFRAPASLPLPTDLLALPSVGSVNVTWQADPGLFAFIDGFNVYRAVGESPPADADYVRLNRELFTGSILVDEDVVDGVRYWYRLTSVSPAGIESLPTGVVWVRVDFTAPAPPQGLTARAVLNDIAGRYEVVLGWEASDDPAFHHYNLFRDPPFPLQGFVPDLRSAGFEDFTVEPDSNYTYRVTVVDDAFNESAPSDPVTVTVPGAR